MHNHIDDGARRASEKRTCHTPENKPKDQGRGEDTIFSDKNMSQVMELVSKLKEIGDVRGKSPGQVALNWLMTHAQTIPIPGAKRPQQAE
jgi:aryl-alcohol dehydrogenase-like predicted oxidoreductase